METSTASADGRYDILAAACPTRQVVNRLGDKWTLLVLYALAQQPYRFRELQRVVEGISPRMLTQTLRNLERDGYVHRSVANTTPPQVTYSSTPLGGSLQAAIASVRTWAYDHVEAIQAAQRHYDARGAATDSGPDVSLSRR